MSPTWPLATKHSWPELDRGDMCRFHCISEYFSYYFNKIIAMPIQAQQGCVTWHPYCNEQFIFQTWHLHAMALIYTFISQLMLFQCYFHVIYFFINKALFYVIHFKKLRYSHLYSYGKKWTYHDCLIWIFYLVEIRFV